MNERDPYAGATNRICPKCTNQGNYVRYVKETEYPVFRREHLTYTCRACGHTWTGPCADFKGGDDG